MSEGLSQAGQKEVVLSVKREAAEAPDDYPRAAFEVVQVLHGLASRGTVVDVGDVSLLSRESPGVLGDPRLRGIAYFPSQRLDDIPLPASSITALPLTQNELDVATQFGFVRFMALLGFRYRYFPTAAWLVRGRPDVTSPTEMSSSLLVKASGAQVSRGHAYLRGIETRREPLPPTASLENSVVTLARQEVVFDLSATAATDASELLARCGQDSPLVLLTRPDPDADASFVWIPGSAEPTVIAPPGGTGTRIAGNHVVFLPGQSHDEVRIIEDGFAVFVTKTTWDEILRLLANAPQNWGMPVSGELGFRLKVTN